VNYEAPWSADSLQAKSVQRDRFGFCHFWEARNASIKKGETTMANNGNRNLFRDDEIVVLTENRDGKLVKSIHPKIGGRLRLAHEDNEKLSITTEIIKYDGNLAVVKSVTSTVKGNFPGLGMASVERDQAILGKWNREQPISEFHGL
jgi:hypothetical protein